MKDVATGKTSKAKKGGTDWEALRRMSDDDSLG
jgi:hypothetical protein